MLKHLNLDIMAEQLIRFDCTFNLLLYKPESAVHQSQSVQKKSIEQDIMPKCWQAG